MVVAMTVDGLRLFGDIEVSKVCVVNNPKPRKQNRKFADLLNQVVKGIFDMLWPRKYNGMDIPYTTAFFSHGSLIDAGHRVPHQVGGEEDDSNIMAQDMNSNRAGDHKHNEEKAASQCQQFAKNGWTATYTHTILKCFMVQGYGEAYAVPHTWKLDVVGKDAKGNVRGQFHTGEIEGGEDLRMMFQEWSSVSQNQNFVSVASSKYCQINAHEL